MRVHWSFLLSILTLAVLFSETPTVALAETEVPGVAHWWARQRSFLQVEGQDGEEDPDDADELFADSPDDLVSCDLCLYLE